MTIFIVSNFLLTDKGKDFMTKGLKIGTKLTAFSSIVIVVSLFCALFLSGVELVSSTSNTIVTDLKEEASLNSNILSDSIAEKLNIVKDAAGESTILSMDWTQQEPRCAALAQQYGFKRIGIALPDGSAKFSDGLVGNANSYSFFKDTMNGKTSVPDPIMGKADKSLLQVIAAPVTDNSGKVIGVVIGEFDGDIFSRQLDTLDVGKNGLAFLLNTSGNVIAEKNVKNASINQAITRNEPKGSDLFKITNGMENLSSGSGYFHFMGSDRFAAYASVAGTHWSICIVRSSAEAMAGLVKAVNISIVVLIVFIVLSILALKIYSYRKITKPLHEVEDMTGQLSKWNLKTRLQIKSGDEIGKISLAVNNMADSLQKKLLVTLESLADGKTGTRIETMGTQDSITPVINRTLDTVNSISGDLNGIIDAAREGNLDKRSDAGKFRGNWAGLASRLNDLLDAVEAPLNEVGQVVERVTVNDFGHKVTGDYKGIFKQLKDNTNKTMEKLLYVQNMMIKVAKGDTGIYSQLKSVGRLSEKDDLIPAITGMMGAVDNLIKEVNYLSEQSVNGSFINARGNAEKFEGGYRQIIEGFNSTLDAISKPFTEIIQALSDMAQNDYEFSVDQNYKGDYKKLSDSLFGVKDRLVTLQDTAIKISEGDISLLDAYRSIGKRSENDNIVPAFTRMMQTLKMLIDDLTEVAGAASAGNLNERVDLEKYNGEYRIIAESINNLCDQIERPTNSVIKVMSDIANCKLDSRVEGKYEGQFKVLVDDVNSTADTLEGLVGKISDVLAKIAAGDLSVDKITQYRGDFEPISSAINLILDSLNQLMSNISEMAEQVSAGSSQVAEGSQTLSQGTTEQAGAVEELTATINDIARDTRLNAENAAKADKLVIDVKGKASGGGGKMKEMVGSMEEISSATANISKIIKLINDIAFQTNILALNAAVEAARAGQYGKGFAVVAEEVRNLAAKSADAVKDTTALIESTVSKVETGSRIAADTAASFGSISEGVEDVTKLVNEIAASSNQQATGISQVDKGISQVSGVVQTNSATAEESAAASEELNGQAKLLKEEIRRFKLRNATDDDQGAAGLEQAQGAMPGGAGKDTAEEEQSSIQAAPAEIQAGPNPKTKAVDSDSRDFGKY